MSFLAEEKSLQLLNKMLDTLIKALTTLKSDSYSFEDRQTDKSKDQAPKHYYFSGIGHKNLYCTYLWLFHYFTIKL